MAEVRFALGATADIATSDEVHSAVKSMGDGILGEMRRSKDDGLRRRFVYSGTGGNFITNEPFGSTTGADIVPSPYRPAAGKVWHLRSIAVFDGSAPFTAFGSPFTVLCVGANSVPSPMDIVYWLNNGQAGVVLPLSATFTSDSITVKPDEQLSVVLDTGSTASTITIAFEVVEYDVNQMVI